jgi:nitrate/nitrite transport system ATP-binding protein
MPEKASIKHLYKQPKSENWLNNSETIFTHIIKAVEAAQPSLSEIEKNALAEVYLRAAFLQNYRSCKPTALSNSLQKQVILALIFASADRVVMLPDIFIQSDFPERALLQRILQNLRLIHENHKIILFLTQQPEEAIFMADRILVVSNKSPNLVGEIIPVRFHEPRNRWIISELPVFKNTLKRLTNLLTDTFAHEDLFTYSPHIKTS